MLARDWYYNERRQIGLDRAVASIYELNDDRDARARATLDMLNVQPGWRVADIVLVDPGVSLAKTAEAALELRSVQRGGRGGEAWSSAMPRAGAIVVLALVVLAVGASVLALNTPSAVSIL